MALDHTFLLGETKQTASTFTYGSDKQWKVFQGVLTVESDHFLYERFHRQMVSDNSDFQTKPIWKFHINIYKIC